MKRRKYFGCDDRLITGNLKLSQRVVFVSRYETLESNASEKILHLRSNEHNTYEEAVVSSCIEIEYKTLYLNAVV